MLPTNLAENLYDEALAHVTRLAGIRSLVGQCTNGTDILLGSARAIDPKATIAVGWIEWDGDAHFKFTDADLQAWKNGRQPTTYPFHCWLVLPTLQDILDVSLPATVRTGAPERMPVAYRYLRNQEAAALGIKHVARATGPDILLEVGAARGRIPRT